MEDLNITIHLCNKEELLQEAKRYRCNPNYPLKYLRGFRYKNEIFIIKDCIGELALLAHEYGHIRGKSHCKFPSIMNYSGVLRWFCYHPKELIK